MHHQPDNRFIDQYKYKGMRKRLTEQLGRKGGFDQRLLQAIEDIPRHFFLDSAFAEQAYEDKAFSIGEGQTISQPYTVVYQTQLLNIKPGDKVLEIGTGSGYQACVLAAIGAKLYSIERIAKLSEQAKTVIKHLGYHVKLYVGDGTLGLPKKAPFDKILVTAAAPEVPPALLQQLKTGGCLVIPVGEKDSQQMIRVTRTGKNPSTKNALISLDSCPLLGKRDGSTTRKMHTARRRSLTPSSHTIQAITSRSLRLKNGSGGGFGYITRQATGQGRIRDCLKRRYLGPSSGNVFCAFYGR